MKICDKYVIEQFWSGKHSVLKRYINRGKVDNYIIEYLKNRFDDIDNIYESLYRIKYGLNAAPKCPICGNPIPFANGYNEYCSRVCANKNPKLIEHRQATILKKYGVTAVAKLDSVKQKMSDTWKNKSQDELDTIRNKKIKTNLEKYGVTCTLNAKEVKDKIKQTNIERYGFENPLQSKDVRNKIKQTNLERYDVEHPSQAKEVKDKIKQTNLEKYGVTCTLHAKEVHDKVKQTNIERYGFEYPTQSKEIKDKTKQTNLERYGFENPSQSKEVKDKIKQTTLERFGVECVFYLEEYRDKEKHISPEARQKAVNTIFERYGKENYANREKAKQTCLERYGVESKFNLPEFKEYIYNIMYKKYGVKHALQNAEIMNKFKNTCLERYGETHHFKTEYYKKLLSDISSSEECVNKRKQTNLKKFGVEYPTQSDEIKELIKQNNLVKYGETNPCKTEYYRKLLSDISSSEECVNKRKQTNLEKFGVEYPTQSNEIKELIKQNNLVKYGETNPCKTDYYRKLLSNILSSKEVQQKIHETKKKNNSYGKSKEEDYVYTVLVNTYGEDNVKRQYKSELYPFACDFYIIPEDLYIEYNGFWTHGFTPYIGSKENEVKLEEWKQQAITSKFYQNAIITWTVSDVKKRNTAKENNLNYIEFWKLEDVIDYIKKYKENT